MKIVATSFNSLQTGKCIQRYLKFPPSNQPSRVSIPFKRESVFKERHTSCLY